MVGSTADNAPSQTLPLITIVIATYNSTWILPRVLEALLRQTYPRDRMEILVVDGGSTDRTRDLAAGAGCIVLDNPQTDPVSAKFIGFNNGHGKYLVYLDHDEELVNPAALAEVVEIFRRFPEVRTVDSTGYINPPGCAVSNEYINEFGDPFSFFVYRQSRGAKFHLAAVRRRGTQVSDDEFATVFAASPANAALFLENLAGAVATDLEFVREHVAIGRGQDLCHLFFLMNEKGAAFAVAKNNPLRHYSGDTLKKFMAKIRWRVKNNIHHTAALGAAGFHGRQAFQPKRLRLRKYLFIPYAFSIIFPLVDAVWLAVTRRKTFYLMHVGLTVYTAALIVFHMLLRAAGIKPGMKSYDEKKAIRANES